MVMVSYSEKIQIKISRGERFIPDTQGWFNLKKLIDH